MKITLIVYHHVNGPAIQRAFNNATHVPRKGEEVAVSGCEGAPHYGIVTKVTSWPYSKSYSTEVFVQLARKEFGDVSKDTKKWKRFDYVFRTPTC